jgi:hypothetical protein
MYAVCIGEPTAQRHSGEERRQDGRSELPRPDRSHADKKRVRPDGRHRAEDHKQRKANGSAAKPPAQAVIFRCRCRELSLHHLRIKFDLCKSSPKPTLTTQRPAIGSLRFARQTPASTN